ncbi:hypothetical protein JOC85_001177 [Bacillus mesophilus]|uniref:Uncharacterized protein n=1 Tax=Bacillus mesophilus TaxID=1808955 RepID=A0A6M0Q410_9BACI|nr:hypothetical protein [Bacillus mesophilus]MBM7660410.1 hypothetical protein [Bacillus mesophilus]NEY71117.1 hypothetical protein [Bacillus mesophilus]
MKFNRVRLENGFLAKVESLYQKGGSDILRIVDAIDVYGFSEPEMIVSSEDGDLVERINADYWHISFHFMDREYKISIRETDTEFVFEKIEIINL